MIYECSIFTHDGNGDFGTRDVQRVNAHNQRDAWDQFCAGLQGNDMHRDAMRDAFNDEYARRGGDVYDAFAFGEYAGDYSRECAIIPLAQQFGDGDAIMRGINQLIDDVKGRDESSPCNVDIELIHALIVCAGEWDVHVANDATGETHRISHVKRDDDVGLCIVIAGDAWECRD